MQQHDAVLGEERGAALEIGVVELDSDMLEHAYRDYAIERTLDVAIVLEQEPGRAGQALLDRAGIGNLQLFGRERDAGDVDARDLGEVEAEPAPAGADIERALTAFDDELRRDMSLLG